MPQQLLDGPQVGAAAQQVGGEGVPQRVRRRVLRQAGEAASRLLVGSVMGLGPLGLLTRAQGVVQIFDKALLDAVSPVVLPALAARTAGRVFTGVGGGQG